ncbi:MAG: hypothetical protein WBP79_03255 [Candidatus Acidiferrales bacterium]
MGRAVLLIAIPLGISATPQKALAQGAAGAGGSSTTSSSQDASAKHVAPGATSRYAKPSEAKKFHNYLFDAFGPYAIGAAALTGAITQAKNSPPEWGQGMEGFGKRVGSTFGIALVTTTTRYGLARVFGEDTIYYRCECSGIFPRLGHALISTVTARRGDDGHRVFSFPALAAPYAGTMTAVLGWYPGRYEPMDGFRIGNFNLAIEAGKNIAHELLWGGPHTLMARMRHKN